jgi:hypothetical protein
VYCIEPQSLEAAKAEFDVLHAEILDIYGQIASRNARRKFPSANTPKEPVNGFVQVSLTALPSGIIPLQSAANDRTYLLRWAPCR